jgi:hypothetical protein
MLGDFMTSTRQQCIFQRDKTGCATLGVVVDAAPKCIEVLFVKGRLPDEPNASCLCGLLRMPD